MKIITKYKNKMLNNPIKEINTMVEYEIEREGGGGVRKYRRERKYRGNIKICITFLTHLEKEVKS